MTSSQQSFIGEIENLQVDFNAFDTALLSIVHECSDAIFRNVTMPESGTEGARAITQANVDWRDTNAMIFIVMSFAYAGISAMIVKL